MRTVLLTLCLLAVGCSQGSHVDHSELSNSLYQRGQRLLQEGRPNEAMADFLKLIDEERDAAESHLEVGRLYLNHVKDPVSAIYHFKKYLELRPEAEEAPMVSQMIETAKKMFLRQLPGNPSPGKGERADVMSLVKQLQNENVRLQKKLAIMQKRYGALEVARDTVPDVIPQVSGRAPRHYKTYRVEGGDTLSRISIKVYGDANRWEDIYQANRDQLNSPHDLRLGQELSIPN